MNKAIQHFYLLLLFAIVSPQYYSQTDFSIESYPFDDAAITSPFMDSTGYHTCIHWDRRFTEIKATPGGQAATYDLWHKLMQVNDIGSAESNNKLYLRVRYKDEFWTMKARVIKDGKVVYTSQPSDVQEVEVEGAVFQQLALEKVDPGSYIESIMAITSPLELTGVHYFQSELVTRESSYTVITPMTIKCESKPYNYEVAATDSLVGTRVFHTTVLKSLPANQDEEYTLPNAYLARTEIRFMKNEDVANYEKWADIGRSFYETHMQFLDGNKSDINKLLKEIKVADKADEYAKIFAIEDYVKRNFNIVNNVGTPEDMGDLIKKKYCSGYGVIRLYMYLFHYAGIQYDLIGTCKKNTKFFDQAFDSQSFFQEVIFYFPGSKIYMDAHEIAFRAPIIHSGFLGQDAMRIRTKEIGGTRTTVTTIVNIAENPATESTITENYVVNFSSDMVNTITQHEKSYAGFAHYNLREACYYSSEDDRKKLMEGVIQNLQENSKVENLELLNYDISSQQQYSKPFITKAQLTGPDLLESAGNKFIFKVGEVIGEQHTMYNEKPRQHPVNIDFTHEYVREITVNILTGMKASGLESLKIDRECKNEAGELMAAFHSEYEVKGNQLVIRIRESYLHMNLPLSLYEDFRAVVNAAADFNRVSLILE